MKKCWVANFKGELFYLPKYFRKNEVRSGCLASRFVTNNPMT